MGLLVFTIIEAPGYGWGSARSARRVRRLRRAARRVHRRRAARPAPDARRAAVPQPAVQRGQRRGHGGVLHPARLHLPDHPVLPVRPGLRAAVHRRAPAPGGAGGRRRLRGRNPAGGAGRHQAGRHGRPGRHGGVLRLGRGGDHRDHQLRHHRRADGRVRARDGAHLRAGDRVHHGRRGAAAGRHRFGGQRLDPPARRHPGRRGDRQCLRLPLRLTADRQPARGPARPGSRPSPTSRSARRTPCPARSARPDTPPLGRAIHLAATNAFLHGLSVGCVVAGGVAAAGAVAAAAFLPAQPPAVAAAPAEAGPSPGPLSSRGNPGRGAGGIWIPVC